VLLGSKLIGDMEAFCSKRDPIVNEVAGVADIKRADDAIRLVMIEDFILIIFLLDDFSVF